MGTGQNDADERVNPKQNCHHDLQDGTKAATHVPAFAQAHEHRAALFRITHSKTDLGHVLQTSWYFAGGVGC